MALSRFCECLKYIYIKIVKEFDDAYQYLTVFPLIICMYVLHGMFFIKQVDLTFNTYESFTHMQIRFFK